MSEHRAGKRRTRNRHPPARLPISTVYFCTSIVSQRLAPPSVSPGDHHMQLHPIAPLTVPLPRAPAATGLSRSAIYRAAAEGKIKLLKLGRSTLVDMQSVRDFLASLPIA